MIKIIKHVIGIILISLTMLHATVPSQDNNLTDEQLHAFLGIITNYILNGKVLNAPTLTVSAPTGTTDNNITLEVNGEVGEKIYVNGVEVGIIEADGTTVIGLPLVNGVNTISIILKDNSGNSSPSLVFDITSYQEPIINEISSAYYVDSDRWFEIYNPTSEDIDISNYTLKSYYYDGKDHGIFEFALPGKIIPSKGYLIVRPNYGPADNITLPDIENNEVFYLKDAASKKYPVWYSDIGGFLEILKDGKTIDFVSIDNDVTPVSAGEWIGTNIPTFTTDESEFWKSIARDIHSTDTNRASDWTVRYFPTYAGLNDVTCNTDDDQDGIPDCSEVNGSTYAGMDLYAYGARINQKDIFIEVDYMDSTNNGALAVDEGVIPRHEALDKVQTAFADNNFTVHFDVGDLFAQDGSAINPIQMDLAGGNEVPYALSVSLDTSDASNIYTIKKDNMKTSRKQIFHYMLFGTSQVADGSAGSSGIAEKPGNDALITLGSWKLNTSTVSNTNKLINYQAGTVMHEFGHNLDLGHGGDEDKNYKPNYLSVMNYLYQLSGLSTIGDNEGDRYYAEKEGNCTNSGLTNPANGDPRNFRLDYSHGTGSNLDEVNGIDEANGLGRVGSNPVDYNCNNNTGDTLTNFNVNTSYDTALDTLHDYNDWAALNIVFARTYSGNNGISASPRSIKSNIPNPIFNDLQPIATEHKFKIPGEVK